MSKHTKIMSSPEGAPWLEAISRLKHWLYNPTRLQGLTDPCSRKAVVH
jgi:hypothetical protein